MKRPWHSFYSERIPYEIDTPVITHTYEVIEQSAKKYPDQIAVIDGEKKITYKELKKAADAFAGALLEMGVKKGELIAMQLPNSLEYIISFYAIHRVGAVLVQMNPMYQPDEMEHILKDSGATYLICREDQVAKLKKVDMKQEPTIILADGEESNPNNLYYYISQGNENALFPKGDSEDLAILQYTGGTTGRPKGVMLTHSNLSYNFTQSLVFYKQVLESPGERWFGTTPLFHVMGMSNMNYAMYIGATYIAIPRFKIDFAMELIRKYRPTVFNGAPTIYVAMLNYPDLRPGDLESMKICTSGSAPIAVEVMREFEEKSGAKIIEAYGLSEATTATHRNPFDGVRKVGSIGIPVSGTDAKIVDQETGTMELPPHSVGELIIKGPQVMKGYWKNPEATAETIRDGWLYTGDLATMDEDGYFYIVGRKKDMIIASGYNIYPAEIEEVLYKHPGVEEVCVYGIPDAYRGETVKAAVVLRDESVTEKELIDWCNERLARYKVPRVIEFRNELPKTAVGKILRRKLVEEEGVLD